MPLSDGEFPECSMHDVQNKLPTIANSMMNNNNATHDIVSFHQKIEIT